MIKCLNEDCRELIDNTDTDYCDEHRHVEEVPSATPILDDFKKKIAELEAELNEVKTNYLSVVTTSKTIQAQLVRYTNIIDKLTAR